MTSEQVASSSGIIQNQQEGLIMTRKQVMVSVRGKSVAHPSKQSFQTELVPNQILEGDALYEKFAEAQGTSALRAKGAIILLEEFILDQLMEGNRLDFGLVSFFPRLSGGLSARDADPIADGLTVRGSVKARRKLTDALKNKLDPVNRLSNIRPRIWSLFNVDAQRYDVISADQVIRISGSDILIVSENADEGVWLEKRGKGKIIQAEILKSESDSLTCVFRGKLVRGKYQLAVQTRCGKGTDFKIRRCLTDVQVV
jgi:hypothetical protein